MRYIYSDQGNSLRIEKLKFWAVPVRIRAIPASWFVASSIGTAF
jgi:hypothetical protein